MRKMSKWLAGAFLGVSLALTVAAAPMARAGDGPALVTVIGNVGNANRAAFNGFTDAFFKFREKEFAKAYAFDYAALRALPQHTVTANAEGWPKSVTATGPKFADVLAAAGVASDATVEVVAIDGYTVEFTAKDRAAKDWILAVKSDGKTLSLGGRGPAWLVHATGDKPASEEDEGKWVWSIFVIAAKP